jgi:hypothetical protein
MMALSEGRIEACVVGHASLAKPVEADVGDDPAEPGIGACKPLHALCVSNDLHKRFLYRVEGFVLVAKD